jgi:hypothetical protein
MVITKKNHKKFPSICKDLESSLAACKNAFKKVSTKEYTDVEGRKFTPKMSAFPETITYKAYQVPRGSILGVKYSFDMSTPTVYIDESGKELEVKPSSEKVAAIYTLIQHLNINKEFILKEGAEATSVVLWFFGGGGFKEEERVYGADYLNTFLVLTAVCWDGKWLRPHQFKSMNTPVNIVNQLNDNHIYYLSDFSRMILTSTKDIPRSKGLLENYLEKDAIRDRVLGINYDTQDTAYACLLLPDYPFFFQRPETWALVKYQDL